MRNRKKIWTTKDGKKIPYEDLEDNHLLNIIHMIERKAKTGHPLRYGGGGIADREPVFELDVIKGEECKKYFNYYELQQEAKKRGILNKR